MCHKRFLIWYGTSIHDNPVYLFLHQKNFEIGHQILKIGHKLMFKNKYRQILSISATNYTIC